MKTTTDYKIFKRLKGNRLIDKNAVDSLSLSVSAKNLLSKIPIIVNENMEIIDGQHRLELAKLIGSPIAYLEIPGASYDDVVRLNTYTRPWKLQDYLSSYIELGNSEYKEMKRFMEKYNVTPTIALHLLSFGEGADYTHAENKKMIKEFKHGKFQVRSWDTGSKIIEMVLSMVPYLELNVSTDVDFIRAVAILLETVSPVEFMDKISVYNKKIKKATKQAEYLRQFEEVIGFGTRKVIRLF